MLCHWLVLYRMGRPDCCLMICEIDFDGWALNGHDEFKRAQAFPAPLLTNAPWFTPVPITQKNQLDFLLSKAQEYSNFIARDLDELQANLAKEAEESGVGADGKKRKRKGQDAASKKAKALENLKTAQAKDAANRSEGKRPIFRQPELLAAGCQLKDYQLEGVRWLASLYENGVSGILADEM